MVIQMTGKVKEKIIRKPKGLKVTEIIGVNKKGEPIEADIDNFDEQVARKEFEAEYDDLMMTRWICNMKGKRGGIDEK